MAQVTVNVQDPAFGAVPGTDCTEAFQKAVDSFIVPPGTQPPVTGGTIIVPAADQPYLFSRPVMVDQSSVHIVGGDRATTVLRSVLADPGVHPGIASPPLIYGVSRTTAAGEPLNDGYWVDLHGLLDAQTAPSPGQFFGYRTFTPEQGFGVVALPCTPFTFGPPDHEFWSGATALTIDFVVRNNAMPWADQQLFGLVDAYQEPSPFWARITSVSGQPVLQFVFRTTDGLRREVRVQFDATNPVLRCSLQLDFTAAVVAAWVDRVETTPDVRLINDGWLPTDRGPHEQPALVQNWYAPFHVGLLSLVAQGAADPTIDERLGVQGDLTFGALRISTSPLYTVGAQGSAQQTVAGPVKDADLLQPPPLGFGCCLSMNEPMRKNAAGWADLQVPWAAPAVAGHGVFLLQGGLHQAIGNILEGITVEAHFLQADNYGMGIGLGAVIDFTMRDVLVRGGAQGVGAIHTMNNSFPLALTSCQFENQTDAAIYSYAQIASATDLTLKFFSRSGIKAVRSSLQVANVFCAGTPCDTVARLFQCESVLDNWIMDFEGDSAPSDSYIWAGIGNAIGGPTQLTVRDCQGGVTNPGTAGIRLVSNEAGSAGLAIGGAVPAWCSIERSFNTYFPAPPASLSSAPAQVQALARTQPVGQALVAVDGPLWQGTYTGLPPTTLPFALNTATVGGSARIGIGTVPDAVAPPPVVASGTDPVLTLPGLIGYYRADALDDTGADGGTVTKLIDLSPAANDGVPIGAPVIRERSVIAGRAAIRFGGEGSGFQFPGMKGTSGAVTMFFVAKRPPGVDTGEAKPGSVFNYGPLWIIAAETKADQAVAFTAVADEDWAVYAVRCAAAPRVLQTWANGHPCERVRRDDLPPLVWATPTLIGNTYGWPTGQMAAAVICDAALTDAQVQQINQHLLNQFQIAV